MTWRAGCGAYLALGLSRTGAVTVVVSKHPFSRRPQAGDASPGSASQGAPGLQGLHRGCTRGGRLQFSSAAWLTCGPWAVWEVGHTLLLLSWISSKVDHHHLLVLSYKAHPWTSGAVGPRGLTACQLSRVAIR